ncbi:hypothetical protein AAFF_G00245540 [Aldrovandia affinis]|uniref:Cyclin N-terminal domain-containing protein n=1 Tax=Aldrovandia affinis TaxID=143900 RepID=A0AAD7RDX0_9TELE|nr:hypothetical protein AAFF_G00245540 [Aldrovandia affinis]
MICPYREVKLDGGRQRHPSGGVRAKEMVMGLDGVELWADSQTVSYTQLLHPSNALSARRNTIHSSSSSSSSHFHNTSQRNLTLPRASSTQGSVETGNEVLDVLEYDPNFLDDPQWPCGKHKRVLIFPSYMEDCGFEELMVAMAFVYFEKLALRGTLNKQNRKLCAGACILLAAKIGGDLKKHEVKQLIDKLEEKFRLARRDLIAFEFPMLVALEFSLHLPDHEVLPHYRRLLLSS